MKNEREDDEKPQEPHGIAFHLGTEKIPEWTEQEDEKRRRRGAAEELYGLRGSMNPRSLMEQRFI